MDDLIQCKHTGQRGRDNECFDCGKRVVSTANATSGGTHRHDCPCCRVKWLCSNGCTSKSGTVPIYRVCSACYTEEDTNSKELELKHELDRFAAFIEAIRDLLRWLRIASNLKLMASGLRDSVGDVLGVYGCSCECTLYGREREHNDDCDGNCTPCEGCAVQRVLNEYYEAQRKLQREGELIEKGLGQ